MKVISLFKLKAILDHRPAISLPEDLLPQVGCQSTLRMRSGCAQLELSLSEQASPGTIGLSTSVLQELGQPIGLSMQAAAEPGALRLGLIVGIIGGREPEDLTERRLAALKNHILTYSEHGGLFICTTPQLIDTERRTVSGHIYCPSDGEQWIKGTCPLPRVLFRRYGVSLNPLLPLLKAVGVRVVSERILSG